MGRWWSRDLAPTAPQEGRARFVPVKEHYGNATFDERWVERLDNGEIWRLVDPDYPFRGAFEVVVER